MASCRKASWAREGWQMIQDRFYTPTASGELIYHYCRPDSFLEIIRSRTMWHSAYSALNDAMEREWGYNAFVEIAEELRGECNDGFIDRIKEIVKVSQEVTAAMISSFSLDGDILSQWRAYADDGHGFAIGFSASEMEMASKPLRVLYDKNAQLEELRGNIRHVFKHEQSIGFKYNSEFLAHWLTFGLDLCAYKNPAFAEEKEIRRVHVSAVALKEAAARYVPLGAIDQKGKRRFRPVPVLFRAANGNLIPYVVLDYTDEGRNAPVKEVVLGPKNGNTESSVALFLNTAGLKNVRVRKSQAPYR
jgi:hypothetical protein